MAGPVAAHGQVLAGARACRKRRRSLRGGRQHQQGNRGRQCEQRGASPHGGHCPPQCGGGNRILVYPVAVSPSRPWSFSYSYVRGSKERIASRSWKGYLRKIVTRSGRRLDQVVTGLRLASQPRGRDRAGVHHEQVLEPPRVRHVLVAGQHQVDVRALEALERVAGVVHDVALAPGARHGQQVVVQHEDPQEGLVLPEVLLDPLVAATADRPLSRSGSVESTARIETPFMCSSDLRSPNSSSKCT